MLQSATTYALRFLVIWVLAATPSIAQITRKSGSKVADPAASPVAAKPGLKSNAHRIIAPNLKLDEKLTRLILPCFEVKDGTLEEAFNTLTKLSKEVDPDKTGVPIFFPIAGARRTPMTIRLMEVPLGEALFYVTKLSHTEYKVTPHAVYIVAGSHSDDFVREWKVPRDFSSKLQPPSNPPKTLDAKDYLISLGVSFTPDDWAIYSASSSMLVVKATHENLDLVDCIVKANRADEMVGPIKTPSDALRETRQKLRTLTLPSVSFSKVTLKDAVAMLTQSAKEADPDKIGVAILLDPSLKKQKSKLTLELQNGSFRDALDQLAGLSNSKLRFTPDEVHIIAKDGTEANPVTKEWVVHPNYFPNDFIIEYGPIVGPKKFFASKGIEFPEHGFAKYSFQTTLLVRNTEENLERIDEMITSVGGGYLLHSQY